MGEHTEGPWLVTQDGDDTDLIITTEARCIDCKVEIANISAGYTEPFESEQQANAHLIAAAPQMLEALKAVLEWHIHDDGHFPLVEVTAALASAQPKTESEEASNG